ncbi:MAG: hypothetical protein IJQ26_06735, partial [Lachnospiraceae bacterium]|nr:hypothetical protein [Lachnospiraceae bacterium]
MWFDAGATTRSCGFPACPFDGLYYSSADCKIEKQYINQNKKGVYSAMSDPASFRKDFPILQNHPDYIYFDNAATAQRPSC